MTSKVDDWKGMISDRIETNNKNNKELIKDKVDNYNMNINDNNNEIKSNMTPINIPKSNRSNKSNNILLNTGNKITNNITPNKNINKFNFDNVDPKNINNINDNNSLINKLTEINNKISKTPSVKLNNNKNNELDDIISLHSNILGREHLKKNNSKRKVKLTNVNDKININKENNDNKLHSDKVITKDSNNNSNIINLKDIKQIRNNSSLRNDARSIISEISKISKRSNV